MRRPSRRMAPPDLHGGARKQPQRDRIRTESIHTESIHTERPGVHSPPVGLHSENTSSFGAAVR